MTVEHSFALYIYNILMDRVGVCHTKNSSIVNLHLPSRPILRIFGQEDQTSFFEDSALYWRIPYLKPSKIIFGKNKGLQKYCIPFLIHYLPNFSSRSLTIWNSFLKFYQIVTYVTTLKEENLQKRRTKNAAPKKVFNFFKLKKQVPKESDSDFLE